MKSRADSALEQTPHDDRGQDRRGRGSRPLEDSLYNIILESWLLRNIYKPIDDLLADQISYPRRQYGHEPIPHRIVHAPSFYLLHSAQSSTVLRALSARYGPKGPPLVSTLRPAASLSASCLGGGWQAR